MTPSTDREYKVFRIENGIVIDHIPHWGAYKVLDILKLRGTDSLVTVGFGLQSRKMGQKDLLKVENLELTTRDINRIALAAPDATINRIKESRIVDKFTVELPEMVEDLVNCANPGCITHVEPARPRHYTLERRPPILKCHYCLHVMRGSELELL